MKNVRLLIALLLIHFVGAAFAAPQERPYEARGTVRATGKIDELVFERLQALAIQPARPCSDEVFLRRAYLDVIGTLPTQEEAWAFLDDKEPKKRARLVETLLARKEFADYWGMRFGDLLRIKAEFPINLWPNGVQAYHGWVRQCLAENLPYDQFARRILTSSGSAFRVPAVNFWRAVQGKDPETLAAAVALTFLGSRIESWPEERRTGFTALFSQVGFKSTLEWKEEIVFHDVAAGTLAPGTACFPDGTPAVVPAGVDPRTVFADWLLAPDNLWFARSIANRLWYWLQGQAIVHEVDDLRDDNPPVNPALLDYLAQELVTANYDLKHVMRLVLNSTTYQLSSIPRSDDPVARANFAFYPLRRLEAEVLVDALCQITGSTEEYSSPIPEPFTYIPEDQRSIALGDGSISSPLLEMFGRPSRDSGYDSERSNASTPAQRLHFLNSSHVRKKIERSAALRRIVRQAKNPRRLATRVYLLVLSRRPTADEIATIEAYSASSELSRKEVARDVVWALLNTSEFLHRH